MERLTILDFCTGNVDIYPVDYTEEPDMDELLDALGHRADDCLYMFSDGYITIHNEVLDGCKKRKE